MKRIIIYAIVAASLLWSLSSCSYDRLLTRAQIPEAASEFIVNHFDGVEISFIERDAFSYEVNFTNGWEIEFNRSGEWSHVDCKHDPVPASALGLLPDAILDYVGIHFGKTFISEMESNLTGYEIGLENGPDLKFSRSGEFRRID